CRRGIRLRRRLASGAHRRDSACRPGDAAADCGRVKGYLIVSRRKKECLMNKWMKSAFVGLALALAAGCNNGGNAPSAVDSNEGAGSAAASPAASPYVLTAEPS